MTTLVLRALTNTGDTTKGTPLTNAEIDGNFIALKTASTSNVAITGGAINNTPIGETTRSSGSFTVLSASGNVFLGTNQEQTVTLNSSFVNGTVLRSARSASNTLSLAAYDVDGVAYSNLVTLTSNNEPTLALTSVGVGTINNMSIGATTRSSGAFTTLTSNGATTLTANTASTSTTTGTLVVTGGVGVSGDVYASTFYGNFSGGISGGATITGGTINNASIGATTRSSGAFTTLTANGATTLTANTASTSTTTGTLVVTGGVGVSGTVYAAAFNGSGASLTSLSAGNISTGTLAVARGGTGQTTYTDGQLLIGNSTGNTLTKATLTAGTGISITNGSGSITITNTGGTAIADDTTTDATRYVVFSSTTSGAASTVNVSSTKLTYNPSTGTLAATNLNSLSDRNRKTNIATIESATKIVGMLDGVSFNWIDSGKASYGVVAQELEKVLPELVEGSEVKTVNYSGIIAFLINAVKELDARVKSLETNK